MAHAAATAATSPTRAASQRRQQSPAQAKAIPAWVEVVNLAGDALQQALAFVPPDRADVTIRQWMSRSTFDAAPEQQQLAMTADAVLLTSDLMAMQPSGSGATALDRMTRQHPPTTDAERAALAGLRASRMRLLRLTRQSVIVPDGEVPPEVAAVDALTGEALRIVGFPMPVLGVGTMLFARVMPLADGLWCLPGAVTPLDPAAEAVARGHPCAGKTTLGAGARWAEAVYCHVVRKGTLDIPGLNRPREGIDLDAIGDADDDMDELGGLVLAWVTLDGAEPSAALLARTRLMAQLGFILDALLGTAMLAKGGVTAIAAGFERIVMVQLETVLRRERTGSAAITLDAVANALDARIEAGTMPQLVRATFAKLRERLEGSGGAQASGAQGSGGARGDDQNLERLLARIQALRARTVAHGCTEAEAMAAASKVAELLDRHGLSLGELDFRAQPCEGITIETDRRRSAPIDRCINAIAAFFDCKVWVETAGGGLRYVFFGLRGDVAGARYLYEMVERAFATETDAFRAGPLYARSEDRRTASNSFQIGLAKGISSKLRTLRTARETTLRSESGRDLVPVKAAMVDAELDKLGLNLRANNRAPRARLLADAVLAGEAAGLRFEPAPGITRAA